MQGDRTIIVKLNGILTNELTAINQYFLHARMYEDWGFKKLGQETYRESIGEMKHADMLVKRILFLDGLPNLQNLNKLAIGETVQEAIQGDLGLELKGRADLLDAIAACEKAEDYVSRTILRDILTDTEEHIDYLETLLKLIDSVGLQNFLQTQIGEG
jgi:bacterioferritin